MEPLSLSGIALDQCARCEEIWFDEHELDAAMAAATGRALEPELPNRGASVWPCPRCGSRLHKAGWNGFLADRCGACRGMFIDVREWRAMLRGDVALDGPAFETEFKEFMIRGGWALWYAKPIAMLLARLFLRA
jgi:Zn-finger nucleic acid-binding protein